MSLERDNFYIVLPSNSSMKYFPDNTTTHFITRLPYPLELNGWWDIALVEIQTPMTILHIPKDFTKVTLTAEYIATEDNNEIIDKFLYSDNIPHGQYQNIGSLVDSLNKLKSVSEHINFTCSAGGFIKIHTICKCENARHTLALSERLWCILGFEESSFSKVITTGPDDCCGSKPASLSQAIPGKIFIYTDICEGYITGDIQAPLLRVVPLDHDQYIYGSTKIKSFSPGQYIPLLRKSMATIEIDIRDEYGKPVPFEYGTLTVTLHFKRSF